MAPVPFSSDAEDNLMNPYSSLCDDFGVYVYINTKMELPNQRETVLHFFDAVQKSCPQMTDFDCKESGEFVLEEDREQGSGPTGQVSARFFGRLVQRSRTCAASGQKCIDHPTPPNKKGPEWLTPTED